MTIEDLHKELLKASANTNNKLDAIVLRLDGIDGRLDGMDHQLANVNRRLNKIDERLSNIEKWIPVENTNLV